MFGTHQAGVLAAHWLPAIERAAGRGLGGTRVNVRTLEELMSFRPLHDRVLIKPLELDERSAGGIIIPDTAKEKPQEGEIVAVGDGARDEAGKVHPLDVKKGDIVLFGKWSGTEVKIDGDEFVIMKETDIMGVIDAPRSKSRKKAA
jgi:chaperonin GroES